MASKRLAPSGGWVRAELWLGHLVRGQGCGHQAACNWLTARCIDHQPCSWNPCPACNCRSPAVLPGIPALPPTGLAFKKGDTEESTRDVRTSSGTFLSRGEDPAGVLAYSEVRVWRVWRWCGLVWAWFVARCMSAASVLVYVEVGMARAAVCAAACSSALTSSCLACCC